MKRLYGVLCVLLVFPAASSAQSLACPAKTPHGFTSAESAYADGAYMKADALYRQELLDKPNDEYSGAGLIRTLLREQKIAEAAGHAKVLLMFHPASAQLLTALAEVQFREGKPWLAEQTLAQSSAIDPCLALTHLLSSELDRLYSMYDSERRQVEIAFAIDPADIEIASTWKRRVSVADEVSRIDKVIASGGLDAQAKQHAEARVTTMVAGLSETARSCQIAPVVKSSVLVLLPSMKDGERIDAYKLEVKLPKTKADLQVDTAASGMFISRALADLNGLTRADHGLPGTVYALRVIIGPLEFRECTLGVSEKPFYGDVDGYIGTDVFSSYLIKLDQPNQKIELSELPQSPGSPLPSDRANSAELREYSPIYRANQLLLVPVTLNGRERRLFVLDSGIRYTTISPELAHLVSTTQNSLANVGHTASGATVNEYKESFNFEFANLLLPNRDHVLELESPSTEVAVGMKLGGMLGFDLLHSMVIYLDYHDGFIKLEAANSASEGSEGDNSAAQKSGLRLRSRVVEECPPDDTLEQPFVVLITAEPTGLWDSGSLKAGESLTAKVVKAWEAPACKLDQGANLYGHVVKVEHSKHGGHAELALVFDRGDCVGHLRQELKLNVIGLLAPDDIRKRSRAELPMEMSGGAMGNADGLSAPSFGMDSGVDPETLPKMVRPGSVTRMPGVELALHSGPHCSALLRRPETDVRIGPKTMFLLTMDPLRRTSK